MGSNTSVSEINTSIQRVSAAANDAAQVAQEARHNASYGGQAVDKTVFSMNRIRNNVQETAKKIKRLGESSQQIGEIVKLIDDIADQTNMLALNAAIQAATAGEQGKGFSVVTEEVRRLAQRSSNAAREIASLVKSIQDDTNAAVVAMEESTGEVVEGSRVADEAGKALRSIEQVVSKLADLIFNISESSLQQAITSSNIARSMNEVSTLTQEATSLRRESSEVVAMVARTAEELRNSVSAFKVTVESRNLEDNRPFDLPRPEYMQYAPPSPNDVPESGAVSWQPTNGEVALSQNEKSDDMSPFIIEDSDFFESMFDEVATSRGNKNAGAETKKPPANQPQALG
jgi:twitching motility protein PilJ